MWASFASVFVLAGLSVVLVLQALARAGLAAAARRAAWLSPGSLSLGIAYVLVLHRLADSEVLSTFWDYTFPDGTGDLPTWLLRRSIDLTVTRWSWPCGRSRWSRSGWARTASGRRRPQQLAARFAAVPVRPARRGAVSAYPFASRLALWIAPLAAHRPRGRAAARAGPRLPLGLAAVALAVVAAPMVGAGAAADGRRATTARSSGR